MKHFIFFISLFLVFESVAQIPSFKLGTKIKPEIIRQHIVENNKIVSPSWTIKIPSGRRLGSAIYNPKAYINKRQILNGDNILLYRIKNSDGSIDGEDSLKIVSRYLDLLPVLYGNDSTSRLYFHYAPVKDLSAEAPAIQKMFSHELVILYVQEAEINSTSILNAKKVVLINPEGVILLNTYVLGLKKYIDEKPKRQKQIRGKLLTETNGKKFPVVHATVSFIGSADSTFTDEFGDFTLPLPKEKSTLLVKPTDKNVSNVIIATQSGEEIAKMTKTKNGFEYKLIQPDIVRLSEMETKDDITLTLNKFKTATNNTLNVVEDIHYASGQFSIQQTSQTTLNKIAKVLKANPNMRLDIISHTDALGNDEDNTMLSQKRAQAVVDYFVSKGIGKTRLKATGKGETEIRNRCVNNVNCSDKEHEYNRRTELRFSK